MAASPSMREGLPLLLPAIRFPVAGLASVSRVRACVLVLVTPSDLFAAWFALLIEQADPTGAPPSVFAALAPGPVVTTGPQPVPFGPHTPGVYMAGLMGSAES